MKHEFNVKKYKDATVYTLESASGGGTSAGGVASVSSPMGGIRKRGDNLIAQEQHKEAPKPRNFVAKNAKMGGAGAHKDKKKAAKQGDVKHKARELDVAEGLNEFAPDGFNGGDDDEGFSPEIAKMAQEDGFTKGASLADGATLERAMTINHWHSQHGGMYKQYFTKGFKEGRMNKIRHNNKQYNLNLKLMKDGSIRHGEQGVAEGFQPVVPVKSRSQGSVSPERQKDIDRDVKLLNKYREKGMSAGSAADRLAKFKHKHMEEQGVAEEWSQKYKSSINCSHPKGFSQKAHCAGKKKHNEDMTMESVCPDCGMCQAHGNLNEIKKGQKDSNGFTKCWPGHHAAGTKKGKNGGQVRNCVPNNEAANPAQQAAIAIAKKKKQGVAEGDYNHGFADPNAPRLGASNAFRNRERNAGLEHEQNNIQISINGRPWKVIPGRGYADSPEEWKYLDNMKNWAEKKSAQTGKKWTVSLTGAPLSEDHSTASQGYGQGGYDTYANGRHGRGVAENPEWYNDEANEMSSAQLKSLVKHAAKLRKAVKQLQAQGDTLEPWQQSKVTKAADYLDAVFNAVDDEQDMGEGWKSSLAGLGLAGAMALGAGGAHARVTGDEDPGVNRLTGKPNVTQVAPDDVKKPDAGPSLSSRYTQGIEFSSEPYTIKADGKEYKFAGRGADNPGQGKVVKVPAALVGVRGLGAVPVTLNPDGKYYMGGDIDENYMEHLAAQLAEKLNPSEPVDTWVQDFQKANPNKYHQFKNKTPQKKAQMAVAAHYAANEPNKK